MARGKRQIQLDAEIDSEAVIRSHSEAISDVTPLQVHIRLMRHYWRRATISSPDPEVAAVQGTPESPLYPGQFIFNEGYAELAASQAAAAAPYVHPKLAQVDVEGMDVDQRTQIINVIRFALPDGASQPQLVGDKK